MKFESFPQKKEENLKVDHKESTEQHNDALLRKLRNLFVAASTLAMTSPALAQKHKGTEKAREPIEVTDKNDKRLLKYQDSLNLYKSYEFQKKNLNWKASLQKIVTSLNEFAKTSKTLKPTTVEELNETRQKNMGKIGETQKIKKDYNYNNYKKDPTQGYDPMDKDAGDYKVYDYDKSLKFNEPVVVGKYSSPDIVHKTIKPVGEYFDGIATSPVYKKPVQPVIYKKPEIKKDTVHAEKVITEEKKVVEPTATKKKEEISTPQIHFKDFGALPLYDAQQHFVGQPVLLENGMVQLTDQNGKLIGKPAEMGLVNQYGDTNTGNTKLEELFGVGK